MLPAKEDGMVAAMHVLGIIGTILCAFASFWLAVRFGIAYKNNSPGVYDQPGKFWETLKVTTMEKGQKVIYSLLAVGFFLLFVAQILSCLI